MNFEISVLAWISASAIPAKDSELKVLDIFQILNWLIYESLAIIMVIVIETIVPHNTAKWIPVEGLVNYFLGWVSK